MSVMIRTARTRTQGGRRGNVQEGGLLSFVGNAVKKVAGIAAGILVPAPIQNVAREILPQRPAPIMPGIGPIGNIVAPPQQAPQGQRLPGMSNTIARILPGGQTGLGSGCMAGFHPNKSGYFTMSEGYVAPGTKCVRNRRRNPLNPRALDRAESRIAGAGNAIRSLGFKPPSVKNIAQHGKPKRRRKR
jgi:hypothetical protein